MKISVDYSPSGTVKEQTVAFFCEEPDLKMMVKFIKIFKKHPDCYYCDDLSIIRAFYKGPPEEIRQLIKDLKSVGCSFEGERK